MAIAYDVKTYPGIGRYLTQADIGKNVVRVFPCKGMFGFIPVGDRVRGDRLEALKENKITIIGLELDADWTDDNWLTVEEYIIKIQGKAAAILQNGSAFGGFS